MTYLGKYVTDFVKTTISTISPFKVEEVTQSVIEEYNKNYSLIDKLEESFYLYKIANYYEAIYVSSKKDKDLKFKTYSLFRFQGTIIDAKNFHKQYYSVIHLLDQCCYEKMDKILLEKICSTTKTHETWTAAHIASFLEILEAFRSNKLSKIINEKDKKTGITALHIAVSSGNIDLVKELLLIDGIDVNILDNENNSVLHLASSHETHHILNLLVNKSSKSINTTNKSDKSPLHIACEAKSSECVDLLLRHGADPNVNNKNEYPIHIAMNVESMECVKHLCHYFPEHINIKNPNNGQSAVHMIKNKPMLDILVSLGANLSSQDKDGNTLLHKMVKENNFDMVLTLLINGADTNIKTVDNKTALHFAVKDCDIDIIRALIVFEIDVNVVDDKKDSARHILCQNENNRYQHSKTKDIILYTLNAVGAIRCDIVKSTCTDGCKPNGDFNGKPPTPILNTVDHIKDVLDETLLCQNNEESNATLCQKQEDFENQDSDWFYLNRSEAEQNFVKKSGLRLLSLDGGGIRGLVLVQTLRALERVSNKRIVDMFDWIGGTSTGGLLAISIVYKMSLKDCRMMYFKMKDEIFVGKRPYSSEYLENVVKDQVGVTTTMTCVTYPKLTVAALLCDRFPPKLHLFRNYDPPLSNFKSSILKSKENKKTELPRSESAKQLSYGTHDATSFSKDIKPPSEQLVWEVAKATGAAPTFFRSCGAYVDGGLVANNPTLDLLTEITEYNMVRKRNNESEEPLGIVVSVGTGRAPIIPISSVDVFRPNNPLDVYNIVQGMSVLTKVIVEMATSTEGRLVDRARAWCHSINIPYFRFSPPLSNEVALDEIDNKIILEMLWDTEAYLYRSTDRLKKLTGLL